MAHLCSTVSRPQLEDLKAGGWNHLCACSHMTVVDATCLLGTFPCGPSAQANLGCTAWWRFKGGASWQVRELGENHVTFYDLASGVMQHPLHWILFSKAATESHSASKGGEVDSHLFMGNIKVLEERIVPEILLCLCLKNRVFHIPTYPRDKCVPSILFSSAFFPLCSLILGIIISLGIFSHCPWTKGLLVLGDGEWSEHSKTKQV